MAIGYETLRRLSPHLPEELGVQLQPQEHRFRSVHGRSSTTHVAAVPTGLGKKGSILKPAVFENEESKHAPFLISLPFLMFCRAVLYLDPQNGLKIHFKKFNFSVDCHLGPTGALRIPLCNFSSEQIKHLKQTQENLNSVGTEFEVFRTEPEVSNVAVKSGPGKSPTVPGSTFGAVNHDGDREETQSHSGQQLQDPVSVAHATGEGDEHHAECQRAGLPSSTSPTRSLEPEHFVRETENYQSGTDRGQLRTDPTVIASQEPEVSGKLLHGE